MGGGTPPSLCVLQRVVGLSPRGRGNPLADDELHHAVGLSPRERGNPPDDDRIERRNRSIPAWAEEPPRPWIRPRRAWVYPGFVPKAPDVSKVKVLFQKSLWHLHHHQAIKTRCSLNRGAIIGSVFINSSRWGYPLQTLKQAPVYPRLLSSLRKNRATLCLGRPYRRMPDRRMPGVGRSKLGMAVSRLLRHSPRPIAGIAEWGQDRRKERSTLGLGWKKGSLFQRCVRLIHVSTRNCPLLYGSTRGPPFDLQ